MPPASRCRFGMLLAWLLLSLQAQALEPAYLAEWPPVAQVLDDHLGSTEDDTMARQMAALNHLRLAIEEIAGPRRWRGLNADEERLRGEYWAAAERIREVVNTTLSNEAPSGLRGLFSDSPLREWYALQWSYERDPAVRAATLAKYLTPPVIAQLAQATATADARGAEAARELINGLEGPPPKQRFVPWLSIGIGVVLLVFVVRGFVRRRKTAAEAKLAGAASEYQDAAQLVVDSLEPYIIAAKAGADVLPTTVLMKPFIIGFLIVYCEVALKGIEFEGKAGKDVNSAMLKQLLANPRFARHFAGPAQEPVLSKKQFLAQAFMGRMAAYDVLMTWSGRNTKRVKSVEGLMSKAMSSGVSDLQAPDYDPTRLHPDGPGAEKGSVALMGVFAGQLRRFALNPEAATVSLADA